MREIDDTTPLVSRQYSVESSRWLFGCGIGRVVEVSGVGPGAADAHVGRPQCGRKFAQARIGEIDGCAITIQGGGHAAGSGLLRVGWRVCLLLVWGPEAATGDLEHFNVVG